MWKKQDRSQKNGYKQFKKHENKNNNIIFSLKKPQSAKDRKKQDKLLKDIEKIEKEVAKLEGMYVSFFLKPWSNLVKIVVISSDFFVILCLHVHNSSDVCMSGFFVNRPCPQVGLRPD